ncbi:EscS/YscS/HrcS family type III secretion system export apparatus protein [Roseateles sp. NT4]|uniref:EscS/YscS/HrcS family type III secretion system export apparatus protein n=1 Tax=Roseateles sp. NT4 TaxID=3453715 RepID=UPI003EEF4315
MNSQSILDLTREGLQLIFWITLPIVLVAAGSALVVAIMQAVTQIQDQSIGQSARLIAVLITIVILGAWMGRELLLFGERAFDAVVRLG